jgi:hypothetical protein
MIAGNNLSAREKYELRTLAEKRLGFACPIGAVGYLRLLKARKILLYAGEDRVQRNLAAIVERSRL